jgi:hypothetical protein
MKKLGGLTGRRAFLFKISCFGYILATADALKGEHDETPSDSYRARSNFSPEPRITCRASRAQPRA